MRTELTRNFRLEAAHRLPNVPANHKCSRLHGHSFHVTVRVGGPVDGQLGWVVDFAEIDRACKPIHEALDHRYLNEIPGLENPTSEILCAWIFQRIVLPAPAKLLAVTVEENCTASCTVYAEG